MSRAAQDIAPRRSARRAAPGLAPNLAPALALLIGVGLAASLPLTPAAAADGSESGTAERPESPTTAAEASDGGGKQDKAATGVDRWIDQLDAPEHEQRAEATAALMQSEALTERQLMRSLRAAASPEQRHRLLRVAMHRYYRRFKPSDRRPTTREPAGSLGIHTPKESIIRPGDHPELNHPAMLVTQIYPGFPAYVHLRPGDLIYGIEGEPFDTAFDQDRFSQLIKKHGPGDRVSFLILRNGERIEVPVRLASLSRLRAVAEWLRQRSHGDPALYPDWIRQRQELLGSEGGAPVVKIAPPGADTASKQQAAKPDDGVSD